jgi:LacI family transcriptional regulator
MISDLTDPSLTSVEQHGYIVGKEAVRLLINRIEAKEEMPCQTTIIKTELVVKGSTRKRG